tara:strand:- start:261 stop:380 length:120 start_codon:yes stop_codon:yes gene_type:complete
MGEREVYKELTTFSQIRNVAVKTQADCGISGLPDKKEMY